MVRTPTEDIPWQPQFPGAEAYAPYGGLEQGVPTAFIARTDPDQGPILTAGSSWYQPADVPHTDLCVGPEHCITLVIFDQRADFIPVQ